MKRLLLFLCVLSLVLGITATALAQLAEIEPNDSFSQAQDLGTGDVSISNLEINPSGDVDYFRWTAGNDGDATFQIFFTHASGDLDLFLFDSSQTEIGISQSITDNEQIDQSVLAGEAYFLIVTGFGGATNTYNLQITGPGFPEPPAPDVIINEIMQNPSAVSDSAGEWFELFNPTAGAIDIDGWTISDNDFDSHVIDNGGPLLIPAGGFLVLGINGDSATNGGVTVDYQYAPNFFLGNSSDEVVLLDRSLNEIDRVEYDNGATFPDPNGASMALEDPALDNNVGANWCESTTPFGDGDRGTPGASNDCSIVSPGDVIINEIMQNPSAVFDSDGEWFELFNPTAGAIDIDGWTISDNDFDSHVIDNGGPLLIPAGGFLVLGINGDSATNGGVTVDYQYAPNFFLGNSSDEVVLLDRSLNEIDRVEYDNGATFPDPNGASMALEDPALDNNVGANWCESTTPFGDGDRGTPGALNVCVPLNQPPVAICQDVTVPTDPGVCTAAVASVDGGSYDPDGDPISMAQSPASFDSLGDTPVILTATDDKGASASCNATVTVVDQEPPVPDVATLPEVSGECSVTLSAPTATDNCAGTITGTTSDPLSYTEEGTHTVTWTFDDANGNTSTQTQTVVVDDTTAPIPDVDPLPTASGECSAEITSVPTATDNCAGTITGTTSDPLSYTEEGTHTVTWTFDDGNGNIATQTQTVEVQDVTPPTISLSASPDTLWPPNHKMVPVSLDVSVSDNCSDPAIVLISVMSSEPDNSNGKGDGNTTNDIQDAEVGTEDYDISLRAERKGSGSGRIYTVTFEATDDSGNSTTASSNVLVPHDAR